METKQGAVVYLGLEEKSHEVRRHFADLGASGDDPIHVLVETAPLDGLERLRVDAERIRPTLIIIDTISRLVRLRDGNDYSEVTNRLEPVLELARKTEAAVLFLHHLGKGERADAADAILGSTAIRGTVDTSLLLCRRERYRTLSSEQRYGQDLEEITLALDEKTRSISCGGTRAEAELARLGEEIMAMVGDIPARREPILEEIEGRAIDKRMALDRLVSEGQVNRTGMGRRGDPYLYSRPPVPVHSGTSGQESQNNTQTTEKREEILVPDSHLEAEKPEIAGHESGQESKPVQGKNGTEEGLI
jgi:hypothetical protein